jgi:hypothetical protein
MCRGRWKLKRYDPPGLGSPSLLAPPVRRDNHRFPISVRRAGLLASVPPSGSVRSVYLHLEPPVRPGISSGFGASNPERVLSSGGMGGHLDSSPGDAGPRAGIVATGSAESERPRSLRDTGGAPLRAPRGSEESHPGNTVTSWKGLFRNSYPAGLPYRPRRSSAAGRINRCAEPPPPQRRLGPRGMTRRTAVVQAWIRYLDGAKQPRSTARGRDLLEGCRLPSREPAD